MRRASGNNRRAFLSGQFGPASYTVASLIVYARPERMAQVGAALAAMAGVEVAASDASGKLIVILESPDESQLSTLIGQIDGTAGVLSANLVYHHSDIPAAEDQPHERHAP